VTCEHAAIPLICFKERTEPTQETDTARAGRKAVSVKKRSKQWIQVATPTEAESFDRRPFNVLAKGLEERGWLAIAANIAMDHHATLCEVLTGVKLTHVVAARDQLIATIRAQGLSWPAIGALLDMNHTSCLSANARHQEKTSKLERQSEETTAERSSTPHPGSSHRNGIPKT